MFSIANKYKREREKKRYNKHFYVIKWKQDKNLLFRTSKKYALPKLTQRF